MTTRKTTATPVRRDDRPVTTWMLLLLAAWPLLVYGRSIGFGFVMHDDDKMIQANPVWDANPSLAKAFTTDAWFMDARIELYRPWQSLTYMLDHSIGGVGPMIYHLHNLLALVAGMVLLFIFLKEYVSPRMAWGATLLYSVNLLMPHAAGWLAARGDLYLLIFGMSFLVCISRYLRTSSLRWLWLSAPLFFLALLAKESAAALLPIAAVMLWMRKGDKRFSAIEMSWLGLLAIAFGLYYWMRSMAIADAGNMSVLAFLGNIRSLAEEVIKMVIPVGFSVMPGYQIAWTALGFMLLAGAIWAVRRAGPAPRIVWIGLAIWLLPLLPSMAYEPSFAGVAYDYLDHRALFPFAGLALIAAASVERMKSLSAATLRTVFIAVLVIWSAVNAWRIGVYSEWHAYYANAISSNPKSGLALLNYGALLRDEGKFEEALPHVQRGVELSPDYTEAHVRLAEIYLKLGRYAESAAAASKALELSPGDLTARQFRGSALGADGKADQAIADFRYILAVDPYNASAIFNLGLAYKETNQFELAAGMFTQLIGINPKFPNAVFERGFCYGRMGMFQKANEDLSMSIIMQPDHGPSYFFRGRAWEALGELDKACLDWREALTRGVPEAEQFIATRCSN